MSGFFQRLFGKDNKPAIARGPLGLHLNSGFTLDTLAFRLLEDELLIALPGEEFTVAAVSHIDLGGGSQIFRYYTSGDEFLQINTTGGEDIDDIDDIKLFVYEESYGISKESHWREAINAKAMGAMTLNWQEKRWQRFFNSNYVNPSLINEVAEEIARLENLITAEEQVLSNLEVSRDGVEKAVTATAQRIAQFEQQMEVVKATEAMQRAQQAVTTSTVGASSSVSTAAESLKRLQTRQAERQARLDAAAQLEKVADGRDLDEKLAEAGIGGSNKSSAQDVLARLQRQQGE